MTPAPKDRRAQRSPLWRLGWALDNALTRPLAELDPAAVRAKGALGATASLALSLALREPWPALGVCLGLLACGVVGVGVSLRLYVRAQRVLGAARTGSIFAAAPFVGAVVVILLGDRAFFVTTALAAIPMLAGVYLHVTEAHRHRHRHDPLEHEHAHRHDDGHHAHVHDPPVTEAHSHAHRHEEEEHEHDHGQDAHHGHEHA